MSQYLDIIVFAVIAVGLLWRLRSVLGDRNESDAAAPRRMSPQQIDGTATRKGETPVAAPADTGQERWSQNAPDFGTVESATAHNRLSQFLAVDPSFRPADFIDKAKKAFGLILTAYSGGNRTTLGYLLTPQVEANFLSLLDAREAARDTYVMQLQTINRAVISDAELDGSQARVTVDFTAEQSITHKNADGQVIGDMDGRRRTTRDRWVFTRDLRDPSPTWLLAEVLSHAD